MRRGRSICVVAAVAAAAGVAAQTQAPLEFGATTEVVALQVLVTDGQGAAVSGLTAEDFEVREDGRPRPIVAFEEIDAALLRPAAREGAASALSAAARRQFILVFDLSFSEVGGLVRARQAAIEFVDTLAASDLVSVATISVDSGVRMLVNLTSDRRAARRAIEELGLVGRQRMERPDPLRLAIDLGAEGLFSREELTGAQASAYDDALKENVRESLVQFQRTQSDEYVRKVGAYLENLKGLGAAMGWVSGRKEVILLSSGFDQQSLLGAQGAQQTANSEAVARGQLWEVGTDDYFGSAVARRDLGEMIDAFSTAHGVIHTVDVTGLGGGPDVSSPLGASSAGAGRETLAQIASGSGGVMIRNTNDLAGALCELAEASRRFYVMAFQPGPGGKPGEFRKLQVKVARKGVRLSHRKGYAVPDPAAEAHPLVRQLEAAEAIAKGLSGGDFPVRATALPYRDASGTLSVPVTLEFDSADLFQARQGAVLELEVYGYALAASGGVEDALVFRGSLDRSALALGGEAVQVQTAFSAAPGTQRLRFVVREAESGRTGTRSVDVEVPGFEPEAPVLYPPLLMRPDSGHVLRVASMRVAEPSQPLQVADRPFLPESDPELVRGQPQRVCVMFWPGGTRYERDAAFDLGLHLEGGDGPIPLELELVQAGEESDGFRRYVLAVTAGDVEPGEYDLRVRLSDPQTGHESESSTRVRVR